MSHYPTQPASVYEIVSWSYRQVFRHLKPLTFIVLPTVTLLWFLLGYIYPLFPRGGSPDDSFIRTFLLYFIEFSVLQVATCMTLAYVQDLFDDTLNPDFRHYWRPRKTWLGLFGYWLIFQITLGIAIVLWIMLFGSGLLALDKVGLMKTSLTSFVFGVLWLLPATLSVWFSFFALHARLLPVTVVYFRQEKPSFIQAFTDTWHLTRSQFFRTMGLIAVLILLELVLHMPILALQSLIVVIRDLHPSHWLDILALLLYMALLFIYFWARTVILTGGALITLTRYYFDLKLRQAEQNRPPVNP